MRKRLCYIYAVHKTTIDYKLPGLAVILKLSASLYTRTVPPKCIPSLHRIVRQVAKKKSSLVNATTGMNTKKLEADDSSHHQP